MKVVNIITGDQGGGGRAAYRLNRGLNMVGCDATLYVASKFHSDPATVVFKPRNDPAAKLRSLIFRLRQRVRSLSSCKGKGLWTYDHVCQRGDDPVAQIPPADLINLHTIGNFFNFAAYFPAMALRVPTVWTMHTMEPFTGGCVYTHGCDRFEERCGKCPILESRRESDLSRKDWKAKDKMLRNVPATRMRLVAPSRWMAVQVARSSLLGRFPVEVIPYGVDTQSYAPRDKQAARDVLQIPMDAKVILFVTQHAMDVKVKGLPALLEACRGMSAVPNLRLLTLGGGDLRDVPVPHTHLGHVFNDNLLSLAYSAADVFVIPSLMDNLPNVVIESMACGTPVVGFDTGGIPEMVRPGQTGALAPPGDVRALREAIESLLLNDGERAQLSARCREVAVKEYALEVQARRYLSLYQSMLQATGQSM